jgi:NAD(P)-dependent dehydrogenase (short-subunit alcohol dehydrogenase family)
MSTPERFASYPSLRERVVLISGGATGIGAAFVELFARQGARVAFLDVADGPAHELAQSLSGCCSHTPLYLHCDLTNISALQAVVAEVEKQLGPVQVLVNNAANDNRHNYAEVTPEYWDNRMNINLRHHFFAIQAVAPGMKAAGSGSIINMSSIAWKVEAIGFPAYATAKAAIVGLTHTMARELGPSGIRVNCVLPGGIFTDRQRKLWITPQVEEEFMRHQCLKRHLLPEDVARLVLFLAADDSSAITNQEHIVDGGWA